MNRQQVSEFVHRFLDASQCRIIEKTPARTTVKLSPEADKALMGRSYYWDFVERTGAPAETMTLTLVFDPDAEPPEETRSAGPTAVRTLYVPGRPPREVITYGCRRLEQMFQTVRRQGMYVMLYEQPEEPDPAPPRRKTSSRPYTTWLAVNFKVEYACDMKREDIHSLGISLSSGEIADRFHSILERKNLTPRLPQHVHLRRGMTLEEAALRLERELERRVRAEDHRWAADAASRLAEELARVDGYYAGVAESLADEEERAAALAQHQTRREEIMWQHQPRIQVSVINCGLFHLWDDTFQGK